MRFKIAVPWYLFLFALLVSAAQAVNAHAGTLFLEGGRGFYFSHDASVFAIRVRIDCAELFSLNSYCEAEYATWNGKNGNESYGFARGIRWGAGEDGYGIFSLGVSGIDRTTSTLGQPFEFIGRLAYERFVGTTLLSFGWTHISDAKFLFGWSGRNDGENFLTLSAGVSF